MPAHGGLAHDEFVLFLENFPNMDNLYVYIVHITCSVSIRVFGQCCVLLSSPRRTKKNLFLLACLKERRAMLSLDVLF